MPMPSFHVTRSILIEASPEKIFSILSDYHHWPAWSPWLIAEPGVKVTVKTDGKEYTWEGKRTGSGEMKIHKESSPTRMDMVVTFLKPWKSSSPVWFELKSLGKSTEVTWSMTSSLPFFMFWMTKMMAAYIGMDYHRGLMMLKDYVETGAVTSRLDFKGIQPFAGSMYVGIKTTCTMDTLNSKMADDFGKLSAWAKQQANQIAAPPFSIYHTWDVVKGKVVYTSAYPVKAIPVQLPEGFITGSIPACNVNTITHTGMYKHLGNAWTTQYMMQRNKEYKYRKGIDPFEVYVSMPGQVPEEQLITEIHFPVA
jgi:predicted transcriptional regulator YdeE